MAKMEIGGNMGKKILLLLIGIAVTTILALMWFMNYGRNDANMVFKIPSGFVHLQTNLKNGLTYTGFETQIVFLDADGVGIYQTDFKNSEFIVKYKGEYYVDEEKLLELLDVAAISPDQRLKLYRLGDEIKIRGENKIYNISILEVIEEIVNDKKTVDIKFSAVDATESDLKSMFSFVEITVMGSDNSGTSNMFEFIDEETIRLEMKADREMTAIVLKSPEYPRVSSVSKAATIFKPYSAKPL